MSKFVSISILCKPLRMRLGYPIFRQNIPAEFKIEEIPTKNSMDFRENIPWNSVKNSDENRWKNRTELRENSDVYCGCFQ